VKWLNDYVSGSTRPLTIRCLNSRLVTITMKKKALWEPHDSHLTNVAKFIRHVNKKHNLQIQAYEDLHRWSVAADSLQSFWRDAYLFLELAPPHTERVGNMLEDEVGSYTSLVQFQASGFSLHSRLTLNLGHKCNTFISPAAVLYFRLPERRRAASSQRERRHRCHPFCPRGHFRN
jgi:hypothetical protein